MGFGDFNCPQVLQNRIIRYYMGVHKFAPVPALHIEMDWLNMRSTRWLEMVRYPNRIASMNQDRLPRIIYDWDRSLKTDSWASSVDFILQYVNMLDDNAEEYKDARSNYFSEHTFLEDVDNPTDPAEICKLILNSHNLKSTVRFLEEMFNIRQKKLYE